MKWLSNSGVYNVDRKNNEDLSILLKNYFERKEKKKQKKHALHVIFGVAGKYKSVTNIVVKATWRWAKRSGSAAIFVVFAAPGWNSTQLINGMENVSQVAPL